MQDENAVAIWLRGPLTDMWKTEQSLLAPMSHDEYNKHNSCIVSKVHTKVYKIYKKEQILR